MSLHTEDALSPLSALQHVVFCERQCALIHVEQAWRDNRLTVEGHILHDRVHERSNEARRDVRIVRGLRLRSLQLGVAGIADVVEFVEVSEGEGAHLPSVRGSWLPYPVEYKRGRPKPNRCDEVQLCAQAVCLEEMLSVTVPAGAIFYGLPRRRLEVEFTDSLRRATVQAARRLHEIVTSCITPPPEYTRKCRQCSLRETCMPAVPRLGSVQTYLDEVIK